MILGFLEDARLVVRGFQRRPWSSLAIAVTLALGIGAATATYAIFNHVVFRPVPGVVEADRTVSIYYQIAEDQPTRTSASYPHFEAIRSGVDALSGLAAWARHEVGFGVDPSMAPRVVPVITTSPGYFDVLGIRARVGRLFVADDYDSGEPVAVVSERFARRHLGSVMSAVGHVIYLGGHPHTIVGVADSFRGLDRLGRDDVWVTHGAQMLGASSPSHPEVFNLVGRLAPGSSIEQVQQQVTRASNSVGRISVRTFDFTPIVFPGLTDGIGDTARRLERLYWILMSGVIMLLVLACANAANLLSARTFGRRRDLRIRAALGAKRARLLRELAIESFGLASIAGLIGLGVAVALLALFQGTSILPFLPALQEVAIDMRVLGFCAGVALMTVCFFGIGPAVSGSDADLRGGLNGSAGSDRKTTWLSTGLVTAQFTLSLSLLVVASLLARSAWHLQNLDLGLEADGVLTFAVRPFQVLEDEVRAATALEDIRRALALVPEVESAAVAWDEPFGSRQLLTVRRFELAGDVDQGRRMIVHSVSPEYFDVLGIPLLAGRVFAATEEGATDLVTPVVVNQALAEEVFGSTSVLGRSLAAEGRGADVQLTIVGVVGNVRHRDLRDGFVPMIYQPASGLRRGTILIRSSLPLAEAAALCSEIVHSIEPRLPLDDVSSLSGRIADHLSEEWLLAKLASIIAGLAALLSLAGLYAVVWSSVSARLRDIAIHMALGASKASLAVRFMRPLLFATVVALSVGGAIAVFLSGRIANRLYGVQATDLPTYVIVAASLTTAAVLAAWLPIRRAARVDPTESFRID